MSVRCAVHVTANFERNLIAIERFLSEQEGAFAGLLSRLFDKIIPQLEEYPELGPDLLARRATSMESRAQQAALLRRLPAGVRLREHVSSDYLILYGVAGERVYLLAIKHHKQLSYDLRRHW